jgi:succinoglycan biosynthesis protein ExoA
MPVPVRPLLVVIPCLNEAEHIEGLVRQLLADTHSPDNSDGLELALRVVVVDGGSIDGSQDIVQRLATVEARVELIDNPGRIQSCALNLAVESFGDVAEYVVRIDAHACYPAGYCAVLLATALATGADSVVVALRTAGTGTFQRAAAVAQNSPLGNGGSAHRNATADGADGPAGTWVDHGHHALIRVAAFRAVGGYDETFTHNEDAELDVRLAAAGYRVWLTYRTWCGYFPRETPGALLRQYLNYGGGRAQNVLKHRTVPKVRQMVPLLVVPAVLLTALSKVSRLAAVPALSWALACLGYGVALGVRERRPATALAGPAAMIMHLGWSAGFWRTLLRTMIGRPAFTSAAGTTPPRAEQAIFRLRG